MGAFKSGKLISFLKGDYDPAHGPTNVERWYTASKHYDVQYVDGCEPSQKTKHIEMSLAYGFALLKLSMYRALLLPHHGRNVAKFVG